MNEHTGVSSAASTAVSGSADVSASHASMEHEPSSFRDRNGAVFYQGNRVFRTLSPKALANWRRLRETDFFAKHLALGQIVGTREAGDAMWPAAAAGVLEHDRVPFVCYPYEWTFGMLKDAALLHLELMRDALAEDMILKDASAYNIQWNGAHPVFIDIPSFEPLERGAPWVGYRQFCELFLYPLMLHAFKGVDFRPWLRGRIDGIPAEDMRRLLSWRDLTRSGVLLHVLAQDALQRRYSGGGRNVRGALADAGFGKSLIANNVAKLSSLIAKLSPGLEQTEWSDYDRNHSYDATDAERKAEFVRNAASTRRWRLAWDLGCNTGTYSRIIADHSDHVVAMDGDHMAIETLYRRAKREERTRSILPLVVNFADASPNQGWLGKERKALEERGRPEITLCLALIHHIVITANIPLEQFIGWLSSLRTSVIIEFVGRDDEMVKILLANRDDQYLDYCEETFRSLLTMQFDIESEKYLKEGKRKIYFAHPKAT